MKMMMTTADLDFLILCGVTGQHSILIKLNVYSYPYVKEEIYFGIGIGEKERRRR